MLCTTRQVLLPSPDQLKEDPLVSEAHKAQNALGVLEIILYHCKKIRPSSETLLVKFCEPFRDNLLAGDPLRFAEKMLDRPVIKELQLKHLCHLYEVIEEVSTDAVIHTIPDTFREELPVQSLPELPSSSSSSQEQLIQKEVDGLVQKICTSLGNLLLSSQQQGARGFESSAIDPRATATAGRKLLEPVLKRFICRFLSADTVVYAPSSPLNAYATKIEHTHNTACCLRNLFLTYRYSELFSLPRGSKLTTEAVVQAIPDNIQLQHSFQLWEALVHAGTQPEEAAEESRQDPEEAPAVKPTPSKPKKPKKKPKAYIDA